MALTDGSFLMPSLTRIPQPIQTVKEKSENADTSLPLEPCDLTIAEGIAKVFTASKWMPGNGLSGTASSG